MSITLTQIWSANDTNINDVVVGAGRQPSDNPRFNRVLVAYIYYYAGLLDPAAVKLISNPLFNPIMSIARDVDQGIGLVNDLENGKTNVALSKYYTVMSKLYLASNNGSRVPDNDTFDELAVYFANLATPFTTQTLQSISGVVSQDIQKDIRQFLSQGGYTDRLKLVLQTFGQDMQQAVDQLMTVPEIGYLTATQLYADGIKDVNTLRQKSPELDTLSYAQKLELKYLDELKQEINLDETIAFGNLVMQRIAASVNQPGDVKEYPPSDNDWILGAYRLQFKSNSHKLVFKRNNPSFKIDSAFEVVQMLSDVIVDIMKITKDHFIGVVKVDGFQVRRLVIRVVDPEAWPFALLWYTGFGSAAAQDILLNRAKSLGYTLTDTDLINDSTGRSAREEVDLSNEEKIYNALTIKYAQPDKR